MRSRCGRRTTCVQLDGYDAVVLGGSLYMGRWHRACAPVPATGSSTQLAERPLAVFALGPTGDGPVDANSGPASSSTRRSPGITASSPREVEIFGGRIDPSQLAFPFSRMQASDARDWNAIEAWAEELSALLGSDAALELQGPSIEGSTSSAGVPRSRDRPEIPHG